MLAFRQEEKVREQNAKLVIRRGAAHIRTGLKGYVATYGLSSFAEAEYGETAGPNKLSRREKGRA